ncbi:MAG: hypothetical protein QM813_08890 [Verrucomicrobiota bacterium]
MADSGGNPPGADARLAGWRSVLVDALAKACMLIPLPSLLWALRDARRLRVSAGFVVLGGY